MAQAGGVGSLSQYGHGWACACGRILLKKTTPEASVVWQEVHMIFHHEFESTDLTRNVNEFMVW